MKIEKPYCMRQSHRHQAEQNQRHHFPLLRKTNFFFTDRDRNIMGVPAIAEALSDAEKLSDWHNELIICRPVVTRLLPPPYAGRGFV